MDDDSGDVRRPSSLQTRLLAGLAIGSSLSLLIAGILLYREFSSELLQTYDHSLSDKARIIRAGCDVVDGEMVVALDGAVFDRIDDPLDPEFVLLRRVDDGKVILASASLTLHALPISEIRNEDPGYHTMSTLAGVDVRYLVERFLPEGDGKGPLLQLLVGHNLTPIQLHRSTLRELLFNMGFLILLIQMGAIWLILKLSLGPLKTLYQQIESANPEENVPFVVKGAPRESEAAVRRLNALMKRVEGMIHAEREFTAMAAHELRTPLAGIRAVSERHLEQPGMPEIRAIGARLEILVENLLILSRADSGKFEIALSRERPSKLVARCWRAYFERAEMKSIDFRLKISGDDEPREMPVQMVDIVLRNFFDNAVEYTDKGGEISAEVQISVFGDLRFRVENGPVGKKLPTETGELLRPFQRGEGVEPSSATMHAGLGLAICDRIARRIGGTLSVNAKPPDRFVARLSIPERRAQE